MTVMRAVQKSPDLSELEHTLEQTELSQKNYRINSLARTVSIRESDKLVLNPLSFLRKHYTSVKSISEIGSRATEHYPDKDLLQTLQPDHAKYPHLSNLNISNSSFYRQ